MKQKSVDEISPAESQHSTQAFILMYISRFASLLLFIV